MSNQRRDHPELALGPNPLLEALAPFLPVKDLPAALRREPLANVDWRSLPPEQRESLLGLSDDHYWPNSPHVHVAAEIQLMLRSGLMQRISKEYSNSLHGLKIPWSSIRPVLVLDSLWCEFFSSIMAGISR